MAGNKQVNSDLEILGKAIVSTVPNNTGTVVTYNANSKEISQRTNTQIIADLGLITATNIASAYYTKLQLQTSGQAQVNWGNLTNIPTSFPATAHNHDDRYYTETESDTKFVPYTGATNSLNLGSYNLFSKNIKTSGTIFNGLYSPIVIETYDNYDKNSILLKVPFHGMGGFKVKIWSYYVGTTGKEFFEFFISNYRYNNGYHFPEITWVAGDSNRIQKVEFLKDANGLYFINIVVPISYPRVAITDCMMADSFPSEIMERGNWGITFNTPIAGLIKEHEKQPADFRRDNFLINKIDNLKIGGRNYILNSNQVVNTTNVVYFQVSPDFPKDKVKNKTLVLSCDYYSKDVVWGTNPAVNHRFFFELAIQYTDNTVQYVTIQVTDPADKNERLFNKFKTLDKEVQQFNFFIAYVQNIDSGEIIAKNFKLEIGDMVSDWSPAPEDQVSDWNQTNPLSLSFIKNKPTVFPPASHGHTISDISGLQGILDNKEPLIGTKNTAFNKDFGTTVGTVAQGNHTHNYSDLNGAPTIPTVNNGTLTLSTGTELNGSATFSANQDTPSTFNVGVANTHKLPTTTEWDSKFNVPTGTASQYITGTGALATFPTIPSYSTYSGTATAGLVPGRVGTLTTKYLREDGTWTVPPDNDTTYSNGTGLALASNQFSLTTAVTTDIAKGVTAHGWGNHASVGYLTGFTETDPTVPAWVKSITQGNINSWNGKYTLPSGGNSTQYINGLGYLVTMPDFALANGTNAIDTWNRDSQGLLVNGSVEGKTFNGAAPSSLLDANNGTVAGVVNSVGESPVSGQWYHSLKMLHANQTTPHYTEIAVMMTGTPGMYYKQFSNGNTLGWIQLLDVREAQTVTGIKTFRTTGNDAVNNIPLQAYSDNASFPAISFHKSGAYAGSIALVSTQYQFRNQSGTGLLNAKANFFLAEAGFVHEGYNDPDALFTSDGGVTYTGLDIINSGGELRIQPFEITSLGNPIDCSVFKHKLVYIRVRAGNKIILNNVQQGQRFILFNVDNVNESEVHVNSIIFGKLSPYTKISLYITNLGEKLFYDKGELHVGGF